jgi:signal transduction histidine kinase
MRAARSRGDGERRLSDVELRVLAEEQAALRRVATLVGRGTRPEEVFAAVVAEVGQLLRVELASICRYEPDGSLTWVAAWGKAVEHFAIGRRTRLGGRNLATIVFHTGRSARMDRYADRSSGPIGIGVHDVGINSSLAAPIVVEGRLWGVIAAGSVRERLLPADAEARLASFTELVAAAIANAESRAGLARLVAEQAALRRVATLVARGLPPAEILTAVAEEIGRLVAIDGTRILRYEADGTATVIAGWSASATVPSVLEVGARLKLEGNSVAALVFRTGQPARIDDYPNAGGPLSDVLGRVGVRSAAGAPIVVQGRLWGVMAAGSARPEPLPLGTESRLAEFTELAATAIANAESRAELAASRARIVAAADQSRRRIERDLHDGTQQRLVSLMLDLRGAEAAVLSEVGDGELSAQLARTARGLGAVLDELREISHGIHPAILSQGGLEFALRALGRRSALTVEFDMRAKHRLPDPVEVAAYYVVSEALTNVTKHAQASVVHVALDVRETTLQLEIRDDGIGGADPTHGSGLLGLRDRVEALGGTLHVTSPAGSGTTLLIELPLESRSSPASPER